MIGQHHQLDGHEFEQAPRVDDGQGSLVCFSPWDRKATELTKTWLSQNQDQASAGCGKGRGVVPSCREEDVH